MTDTEINLLALTFTRALQIAGCDAVDALAVLEVALKHGHRKCPVEIIVRASVTAERAYKLGAP